MNYILLFFCIVLGIVILFFAGILFFMQLESKKRDKFLYSLKCEKCGKVMGRTAIEEAKRKQFEDLQKIYKEHLRITLLVHPLKIVCPYCSNNNDTSNEQIEEKMTREMN